MTALLPTLAVAFTAFCVWLTVRIVNRRERWAKWMLAVNIGTPVLYLASFGPACRLVRHEQLSARTAAHAYRPLLSGSKSGPDWLLCAVMWYGGTNEYQESTFLDLDNVLFRESWGVE